VPFLVFAVAAAFFAWFIGNRIEFGLDEGGYLEGAVRVLHGAIPYRDFFVLTGPATFWNVAFFFRLFGVKLSSARLLLVLDLSILTACVYWLGANVMSMGRSLGLTVAFVALLILYPGNLIVNHRWDSAALSLAGICFFYTALASSRSKNRLLFCAAGLFAAYSAWATPSMILVLAGMFVWLVVAKEYRGAVFCASGALLVCLPIGIFLVATGSLQPMIDHLRWTAANYSKPSRIIYGGIFAGYGTLFHDAHGLKLVLLILFTGLLTLPASAPVVAALGFFKNRRTIPAQSRFLFLSGLLVVLSCYPRMDIAHLAVATPLSFVLAATSLPSLIPARLRFCLGVVFSFATCFFASAFLMERAQLQTAESRAGQIVGDRQELSFVRSLERAVKPGESLFVFPYMPVAYFVTGGANPTRYAFLHPGLMTNQDEREALSDLEKHPPAKVLYAPLTGYELLRMFPGSAVSRLKMPRIDAWLADHYQEDATHAIDKPGVTMLVKRF
jgi:hypothetical protein